MSKFRNIQTETLEINEWIPEEEAYFLYKYFKIDDSSISIE